MESSALGGKPPILRDLETLERSILDGLKALALTPQAAASLNLTLTRARTAEGFNVDALNPDERAALERLLDKARTNA
jgi:hypothetical protein